MTPLTQKYCIACERGTPPLSADQAQAWLLQVPDWTLADQTLSRKFRFKTFPEAMTFVNRVAALAEAEGHHPDFHISWTRVRLDLTTYVIKGLSENDFILAAKINELVQQSFVNAPKEANSGTAM